MRYRDYCLPEELQNLKCDSGQVRSTDSGCHLYDLMIDIPEFEESFIFTFTI